MFAGVNVLPCVLACMVRAFKVGHSVVPYSCPPGCGSPALSQPESPLRHASLGRSQHTAWSGDAEYEPGGNTTTQNTEDARQESVRGHTPRSVPAVNGVSILKPPASHTPHSKHTSASNSHELDGWKEGCTSDMPFLIHCFLRSKPFPFGLIANAAEPPTCAISHGVYCT